MAETKVTKNEIEPQEAWINVSFQNSWANFGGNYNTAQYMKDSLGFVHVKGVIKSGTMGQTAFTLPAGYRPGGQHYYVSASNGGIGIADIFTNGEVRPQVGTNGSYSVDYLFRAEN